MRPPPAILVVLLVVVAALGHAGPALAGPAEPYSATYCDPGTVDENGDLWQDCYTITSVIQLQTLPSGDIKYTSNNKVTNTTTRNGDVVYTDSSSHHFTDVFRAGDQQISRSYIVTTLRFTDDATGETTSCEIRSNYVVVDGELRHHSYSDDCG